MKDLIAAWIALDAQVLSVRIQGAANPQQIDCVERVTGM